jgi:acetyl esterase/lipase
VTSDAFSGAAYVPARLRHLHTSAWDPSFVTVLGGVMTRRVPRDGLPRMPLEADEAVLANLSKTRHWVQLTTNDTLYSDGLAYVAALRAVGVQVEIDVVFGWPHTFWLLYPHLRRALEADEAMLEGLRWVAGR